MILVELFTLLMLFQFKHLIADYYLQVAYMYENKGQPKGWATPLAMHALVHFAFTFSIILGYCAYLGVPEQMGTYIIFIASTFDFVTHFVTDRWKATRGNGPDTEQFWLDLGKDQMVHHIVGIFIVFGAVFFGYLSIL